jgi:hypothetical protein
MTRFLPLLALLAAGCAAEPGTLPMAATADGAKAAVHDALTAWKNGATQKDLSSRTPPVYLNDDDLVRGRKLTAFTIDGEPTPSGTGMKVETTLTLDGGGRPSATRKVPYRVVLTPQISIAREDR